MRPWLLALLLLVPFVPACDSDDDPETDTIDTEGETSTPPSGEVVSGLDRSRALSSLSDAETTTLCEALATTANAVYDAFATYDICTFTAVANSIPLVAEQGLDAARSACDSRLFTCQDSRRALSCEEQFALDLERWSGCGLTVGDVELCRSAANAHTMDGTTTARDAGITCESFDETTDLALTSSAQDTACVALEACP